MKIDGKLTICERGDYVEMEIMDEASRCRFLIAKISHKSLIQAIARLACVQLDECEVVNTERIGKTHEHKPFTFEIPEKVSNAWKTREKEAGKIADKLCPKGWEPDCYFGRQGSFTREGDKCYATCTIRRYV